MGRVGYDRCGGVECGCTGTIRSRQDAACQKASRRGEVPQEADRSAPDADICGCIRNVAGQDSSRPSVPGTRHDACRVANRRRPRDRVGGRRRTRRLLSDRLHRRRDETRRAAHRHIERNLPRGRQSPISRLQPENRDDADRRATKERPHRSRGWRFRDPHPGRLCGDAPRSDGVSLVVGVGTGRRFVRSVVDRQEGLSISRPRTRLFGYCSK